MIATQSAEATRIGKEILQKDGNAVDAAVAAALALGVSEPQASGLGGQTMMLIGDRDGVLAIDGSSRSPSLAHADAISKQDRSLGYRATTVPSTPATLKYVHKHYGKLKWRDVVRPSAELAEQGYAITELQASLQKRELDNFKKVPSQSGFKYFLKDGKPYKVGDIFRQPDLARCLKAIATKGVREFYQGSIAKQIDADMRANNGLVHYDDLVLTPWPIERKPVRAYFNGVRVYSMPPAGAGRTLVFALNMLKHFPKDYQIDNEKHLYHIMVQVIRKAFLDRDDRPHDPHFFAQHSSQSKMLNDKYAHECIKEIVENIDHRLLPVVDSEWETPGETTHLSVIDRHGLSVSLTQSIERVYGSKAAAEGLGFLYNNYMYDYEYEQPDHPYYVRPNRSPWATVAPTLLFNKKEPWMALGSPGSERIASTLLLFIYRVIVMKQPIDQAMRAPRIHCSLGGKVSLEAGRFSKEVLSYFKKQGYKLDKREDYAFLLGCVQAVIRRQSGEGFQAVADVRRDGTAM